MTEKLQVIEALSKVMEEVRSVRKDGRNQQQGFVFRGIDAVMNAVGPALRKHGVVIVPEVLEHNIAGSQTSKGNAINVCRVKVQYTVHGPDGGTITGVVPGESMDSGDKATAKAMSVAYRTFLLQALTLPTDEADPDQDVYEAAHKSKPQGPNWNELFAKAKGDRSKLEALRNQGKQAGLADDFGMFGAIETELAALAADEPIEGKVTA